ncbi:MAG: hypothetical protein HUJ98_12605 [Bacteroidaceae bacterium]|nr:hypothetical protein [Bacteroidaceae bacterium]
MTRFYDSSSMEIGDNFKYTKDKLIVFEENARRIAFDNQDHKHCFRCTVDGGIITEGPRCDFLLIVSDINDVNNRNQEHYIELKGSDVLHAIDQLEATIKQIKHKKVDKRCAYVVCKRVNKTIKTKIQISQAKFKNTYQCNLLIGENFEAIKV